MPAMRSRSGRGSRSEPSWLSVKRVSHPGSRPAKKTDGRSANTCSAVSPRHTASRRSSRPSATMTAVRAPAEDPAARLGDRPPRRRALATPASHAPFAPPPDRTSAVGASRGRVLGSHRAKACAGEIRTRTASAAATRWRDRLRRGRAPPPPPSGRRRQSVTPPRLSGPRARNPVGVSRSAPGPPGVTSAGGLGGPVRGPPCHYSFFRARTALAASAAESRAT